MKKTKRLFIMKKSQIVTVTLICMLVLAGYLNYVGAPADDAVTVNSEVTEEIPEVENYGEARFVSKNNSEEESFERETQLSRAKELLSGLSENKNISPEQRAEAEKKLVALGENIVREANIISVLSSSGIEAESVVAGEGGITVTLKAVPDETTLDIIADTVIREGKVTADKVIVKVKE